MKWPCVGNYKLDIASFESLALPELQTTPIFSFVIDELGKMEMFSPSFFPAVRKLLDSNIPLLASIPSPTSCNVEESTAVTVINLSESNRDSMKEHIFGVLSGWLPKR